MQAVICPHRLALDMTGRAASDARPRFCSPWILFLALLAPCLFLYASLSPPASPRPPSQPEKTARCVADLGGAGLVGRVPEARLTAASTCALSQLAVLFLSGNALDLHGLPLQSLTALRVLALKDNRLQGALPLRIFQRLPHLEQLILTDNSLNSIDLAGIPLAPEQHGSTVLHAPPAADHHGPGHEKGQLLRIRKLMMARNLLTALPHDLARALPQLELIRLAHNEIESVPASVWSMPRLAWVALAGNPVVTVAANPADMVPLLTLDEMQVGETVRLGGGRGGGYKTRERKERLR